MNPELCEQSFTFTDTPMCPCDESRDTAYCSRRQGSVRFGVAKGCQRFSGLIIATLTSLESISCPVCPKYEYQRK